MNTEKKLNLILSYQKKIRKAAIDVESGLKVSPDYVDDLAANLAKVRESL